MNQTTLWSDAEILFCHHLHNFFSFVYVRYVDFRFCTNYLENVFRNKSGTATTSRENLNFLSSTSAASALPYSQTLGEQRFRLKPATLLTLRSCKTLQHISERFENISWTKFVLKVLTHFWFLSSSWVFVSFKKILFLRGYCT